MNFDIPNPPGSSPKEEAALATATVYHCSTLNEAQIVVSLLGSYGIPASIEAENYLRMIGSMAGLDGVRVQVRQLDLEAAREILEETTAHPEGDAE